MCVRVGKLVREQVTGRLPADGIAGNSSGLIVPRLEQLPPARALATKPAAGWYSTPSCAAESSELRRKPLPSAPRAASRAARCAHDVPRPSHYSAADVRRAPANAPGSGCPGRRRAHSASSRRARATRRAPVETQNRCASQRRRSRSMRSRCPSTNRVTWRGAGTGRYDDSRPSHPDRHARPEPARRAAAPSNAPIAFGGARRSRAAADAGLLWSCWHPSYQACAVYTGERMGPDRHRHQPGARQLRRGSRCGHRTRLRRRASCS